VTDWKRGKTFVPSRSEFASPEGGKWRVSKQKPTDWPDLVKRLLMTAGPAAFGGEQPNRWFIHHRMGPSEDPSATYVWLGHLNDEYAARKGGPAPSP
jgi:hypothetical protein